MSIPPFTSRKPSFAASPPTFNPANATATLAMVFVACGFSLTKFVTAFTISVNFFTPSVRVGNNNSPSSTCKASKADCANVILPLRLSNLVSAICLAAPSQLYTASVSLLKSASDAFTIASIPAKLSFPKIVVAAATCSASDNPPKLLRRFFTTSPKLFIEPSAFVRLMPYFSIAAACASVGFAILANAVFKLVPATSALILAFAISPIPKDISSTLYPNAPATGATFWNVDPIILTLVFALLDACANTSEKCPASDALNPKAVKASVTISDTLAKSSPEAAARFIIPSIPPNISSVFHPAIAMYSIACPASVAVNFVDAPISLALFESWAISSVVAPDIAFTPDICS